MIIFGWILLFLALFGTLAYVRSSLVVWTAAIAIYLLLFSFFNSANIFLLVTLWIVFLIFALPLNILPLRRHLITSPILNIYRKVMPPMSRTEKEALEAGTVGWDQELFSGMPNWKVFASHPAPKLTAEEQAFLDGPVEKLCRMSDDWDITHNLLDLPKHVWDFIKQYGFFGMIIPKKYGGLEFSALAHSAVITKLSGRSVSVATTVSVPNSLGPAELLLHYGTEAQKDYYLPRLARGEEIPCFALTGPEVGSDAGAMPDYGIVCRDTFEGNEIIGIRLFWNKRYITLAPIATVLGLAFKLYDPEHLIGKVTDWGITCALIPTKTPGVVIGRRHFPLNAAFLNGPTHGENVFIPLDWIIGGQKMAGQGWRMLVESLSTGRALSLPATVTGGAKIASFATGAYARIRRQFGLAIGKFEGVQEVLARIGAFTYLMNATRLMTVAAIDRGERPSVPSAISKYHCTELGRKVCNDAMDIHGGKGIMLGPRNYLGRGYEEAPIGITVEGANILTRSLIIFGQGAIRCHPYVLAEMTSAKNPDPKKGLKAFDKALFGHIGFMISNSVRSFILGITNGRFAHVSYHRNKHYYQLVTRFSAAFALVSDIAMLLLGGELKRRESLSGRFGDVLSMMYLTSAVLKQYEDQNAPEEDLPIVQWACQYTLYTAQQRLHGILKNFPSKIMALWLHFLVFPLGKQLQEPNDKLSFQIANLLINQTASRDRLAEGVYTAPDKENPVGMMNEALRELIDVEALQHRMYKARHDGVIAGYTFEDRIKAAMVAKIITAEEAEKLMAADKLRKQIYAVDDFSPEELARIISKKEDITMVKVSNYEL